ncbi:hypothetical protein SDRG_11523 [Saprolegnia diclina VS20]|uniref:NADH-ubiquinone reductase complex 1 MLRQ subunit n=1 Tax=Saprolegnia diclina (strain VS20) TaxID=1156394 RepID=T0Q1H1_SAPDV|nr:hypothetical protein SDRG_11523 [Saprolegnia diclina VS20]XP_008619324.1 hypothetical protein SDRG_14942 [Saprolegnia diclina VS20]EQC27225.1 hypothetical protein SDRG_14942 [Saprolegnia diclina VS20]EQC30762.1 hypothetical protein SDRG_11523 [Saprolegnia diclina VS20]|eukprot:XP_008615786.1 hypothetical protein SDRG_11523 [Saprolegnia diclina VS20]
MASTTARATQSVIKTWFSDPATYPIIGIITFATGMSTFAGLRYLSNSPDVTFSKEKRGVIFHRSHDEGASFRSHRIDMAHLKLNPITRNDDFVEFRQRHA